MSLKNSSGFNPAAVKPFTAACYDNNLVNSKGIFLGDVPIRFALPLLLLELSIIFILSSTSDCLLRRLGVPRVVTQLLVPNYLSSCINRHLKICLLDSMYQPWEIVKGFVQIGGVCLSPPITIKMNQLAIKYIYI